ncbi:sodium/pantothenate symporter [Shewanella fidelis]|uniref:Sodium/pantothenate symporter n=1 Tax=Shewanella fidelis TaxID=173509 RepID=A0AAW8NJD6_9GAMM|nr:sodium/pantothenate symporter [Shewanella fidelis]MDR8523418.1 sodium/pantothenate symporter [Shewanella fidelis]MDW4813348.1 sodium/pantothenate symporter [Shewanella fidelis]MDW4817280.1 sodium/pantothenate symporter [Shewanella fidelis]MDW4821363.1 sodium/pantothenate symporter [Shewanella fidelis]MDW4824559.1 sodium/pantothenate symporter [Shewanella fidelis]
MTSLLPVVIYLGLSLVITRVWSARQTKQSALLDSDKAKRFFIGGAFLGGPLLALTLVATYTSAGSFIGGPGAAYKFGLGWVWLAVIQVPVVILALGVLGPKFLAQKQRYSTIIEWLDARYHNHWLSMIAMLSLVIGFIAMIAVQFIGGARLLAGVTGISYELGLAVFVLTVLAYTLTGGFRAVVLTDALQGMVMLLGLFILLAVILSQPQLGDLLEQTTHNTPELVSPHGVGAALGWPMMLSFWVLICFGTMGLPHTIVRLLAVKDTKSLKRGMIWGTIICFLMTLIPHLCGFFGRVLFPELAIPDEIMPTLIAELMTPFWAGILLAAPIAAVMSSVDSMLLQSAVSIVRDGAVRAYPQMSATRQVRFTQAVMLVITVLACFWAVQPPDMIVWINLAAFGALQAVFLWPIIAGLFWPSVSARSALIAMCSGLISYLALQAQIPLKESVHPIVPALTISLLMLLLSHGYQGFLSKRSYNAN